MRVERLRISSPFPCNELWQYQNGPRRRNDFVLWCPLRLTREWHINSYEKYPLELIWFPWKSSRHFQMQPDSCPLWLSLSLFPVLERVGVRFLCLLSEWAGMSHVAAALEASALGQEICSWPPPQPSLPIFPPVLLFSVFQVHERGPGWIGGLNFCSISLQFPGCGDDRGRLSEL